jgi:hypothetical protein
MLVDVPINERVIMGLAAAVERAEAWVLDWALV